MCSPLLTSDFISGLVLTSKGRWVNWRPFPGFPESFHSGKKPPLHSGGCIFTPEVYPEVGGESDTELEAGSTR